MGTRVSKTEEQRQEELAFKKNMFIQALECVAAAAELKKSNALHNEV